MDKAIIYMCSQNHHWLGNNVCPFCGEKSIKTFNYQQGDCIKCGNLCPGYAYGCTSPEPIEIQQIIK